MPYGSQSLARRLAGGGYVLSSIFVCFQQISILSIVAATAEKHPYLKSALLLVSFDKWEKIRHSGEVAERYFSSGFSGAEVQYMNVPKDVPPNAARYVLSHGTKQLTVSQIACQLTLDFESMGPVSPTVWDTCEKYSELLLGFTREVVPVASIQSAAVIFSFNFRSELESDLLNAYLYDKLIKVPAKGPVAGCNVTLGYSFEDSFFVSSTWNAYEVLEITTEIQNTFVDVATLAKESGKLRERGIALKLDINDRPRQKAKRPFDMKLFPQVFALAKSELNSSIPMMFGD